MVKRHSVEHGYDRAGERWHQVLQRLDIDYAYRLAKRMEKYKTNPALGYRTAGSEAERLTGDMLAGEMEKIGLTVLRDEFTLDGWTFDHARLTWETDDEPASTVTVELGGYQTSMNTHGPKAFSIVYAGRGTASEIEGLDLSGKLVLITIDQRNEWWINYPAYQAHLHGAAAIIAVQSHGYGEVNARALNAQDICGPEYAPAFSISKHDAKALIKALGLSGGKTAQVVFDAESTVIRNAKSRNITGIIEGEHADSMVLMSAHYDSYFEGFQDDNTAVAMMLSIARAIKQSGIRPQKTLAFCAMAAEEWGVCNSQYDWSTGAYNQIFKLHPEWVGRAVADINLELPARKHAKRHYVRCVPEYKTFLKLLFKKLPEGFTAPYPNGLGVITPVQTWSDDFSMAIAGVPSMVNDFGMGSFMETHYHSQFDNDSAYDREAYEFHHKFYSRLLLAFDAQLLPPLHFGSRLEDMGETLTDQSLPPLLEGGFRLALENAQRAAKSLWYDVAFANERYTHLMAHDEAAAQSLLQKTADCRRMLLALFLFCQNSFVALDWYDEAMLPHEVFQYNLDQLRRAVWQLATGSADDALESLGYVDNNRYAVAFDREVFDYFTDYVLHQPADRLLWGSGRVQGHLDMFDLISEIKRAKECESPDFSKQIDSLKAFAAQQHEQLEKTVLRETKQLVLLSQKLSEIQKALELCIHPVKREKDTHGKWDLFENG